MSKCGGCDHFEDGGCFVNPMRAVRKATDKACMVFCQSEESDAVQKPSLQESQVKKEKLTQVLNTPQTTALKAGQFGECRECVHLNSTTCRPVPVSGTCDSFELFESQQEPERKARSTILSECCLCGAGVRIEVVYRTQCVDCEESGKKRGRKVWLDERERCG